LPTHRPGIPAPGRLGRPDWRTAGRAARRDRTDRDPLAHGSVV